MRQQRYLFQLLGKNTLQLDIYHLYLSVYVFATLISWRFSLIADWNFFGLLYFYCNCESIKANKESMNPETRTASQLSCGRFSTYRKLCRRLSDATLCTLILRLAATRQTISFNSRTDCAAFMDQLPISSTRNIGKCNLLGLRLARGKQLHKFAYASNLEQL